MISRLRSGAMKLLRDQGGNALILTAAAIIPVIGIAGSAIDIGRAYMAQLRLQQACDAGVLAGRRAMGGGEYDDDAKSEADKMFGFNFPTDLYGSEDIGFSSNLAEGEISVVEGIASTRLPTKLMQIFGFGEFNLNVTCKAKMEIAHTDVMLVLDVTGSMKNDIQELKDASNDFLTTILATSGDGLLRVGVVPYSTTVNVGRLLQPEWLSNNLTVPSREYGNITQTTTTYKNECTGSGWKQTCKQVPVTTTSTVKGYRYKDRTFEVGALAAGSSKSLPGLGTTGGNVSVKWDGCIVERQTVAFDENTVAPDDALDMDIDMVPDDSNEGSKWQRMMPLAVWSRSGPAEEETTSNRSNATSYCPAKALGLTVIRNNGVINQAGKEAFETTISGLAALGNTYHDVGMAWGARLISPNGLFSSQNGLVNGRTRTRHIVYMTDGEMQTSRTNYTHQGVEQAMPRVTENGTDGNLDARHTNRFLQLCAKARSEGIAIWVIGFGAAAKANASTPALDQCSSSGTAYKAVAGELEQTFRLIAGQIARLRLTP